ncbi:Aste57867_9036 [Aphanomyces stellatus]|uniref:Aste57867_9036 protein n=1 Tax=Aphanomyces stellatus TaxID=120398 RepID=A0A485KLZ8_9STRA|nr:hypothetical protein As57867_009000 [Aphanomyces stellatus]VFT85920.1 Aste57867_9036 [Aphanomyces stellatus]
MPAETEPCAPHAAISFRVLLSNDTVYRFQCCPSQHIKVIFDHIPEFRAVDKLHLHHVRSSVCLDGRELVGQVLVHDDVLTALVLDTTVVPTTICVDEHGTAAASPPPLDIHLAFSHLHDMEHLASLTTHLLDPDNDDLFEQANDRDTDRWRKAHVSRIQSSAPGTSVLNISPLEIEFNTRVSHHDLMLHAALQLTENALTLQQGIRTIYLHLRSHQSTSDLAKATAQRLLALIRSTDRRPIFLHRGIDVVLQGYVDCGKWGALWRTKQRCWAVLWDSTLSFFASPDGARKYMFALSNERRRHDFDDLSIGKRIQRDYAPHTEFHLSGWSVRPGAPQCERNTFALFDETGALRQVLDVASAAETEAWVHAIGGQAQQHLVRLQAKLAAASVDEYIEAVKLDDGTLRRPVMEDDDDNVGDAPLKLRVPLKWLHVLLESQDATSRSRRLKCSNFSQAVKDIQRDVLRINGHVHASSCFEDMLSELSIELMQHTSCQTKSSEMDAMAFARQLLILSSRTHGGGDVLDAVHALLHSPHFCICPEMSDAAPVDVEISLIEGKTVVEIVMTMVFKLIPSTSENSIGRIVGTSRQRVICDMTTHFDVDGDILIVVERPGAKRE